MNKNEEKAKEVKITYSFTPHSPPQEDSPQTRFLFEYPKATPSGFTKTLHQIKLIPEETTFNFELAIPRSRELLNFLVQESFFVYYMDHKDEILNFDHFSFDFLFTQTPRVWQPPSKDTQKTGKKPTTSTQESNQPEMETVLSQDIKTGLFQISVRGLDADQVEMTLENLLKIELDGLQELDDVIMQLNLETLFFKVEFNKREKIVSVYKDKERRSLGLTTFLFARALDDKIDSIDFKKLRISLVFYCKIEKNIFEFDNFKVENLLETTQKTETETLSKSKITESQTKQKSKPRKIKPEKSKKQTSSSNETESAVNSSEDITGKFTTFFKIKSMVQTELDLSLIRYASWVDMPLHFILSCSGVELLRFRGLHELVSENQLDNYFTLEADVLLEAKRIILPFGRKQLKLMFDFLLSFPQINLEKFWLKLKTKECFFLFESLFCVNDFENKGVVCDILAKFNLLRSGAECPKNEDELQTTKKESGTLNDEEEFKLKYPKGKLNKNRKPKIERLLDEMDESKKKGKKSKKSAKAKKSKESEETEEASKTQESKETAKEAIDEPSKGEDANKIETKKENYKINFIGNSEFRGTQSIEFEKIRTYLQKEVKKRETQPTPKQSKKKSKAKTPVSKEKTVKFVPVEKTSPNNIFQRRIITINTSNVEQSKLLINLVLLTNFSILGLFNEKQRAEYNRLLAEEDREALQDSEFPFYKIHIFDFDSLDSKKQNQLVCGYYIKFSDKCLFLLEAESSIFERFKWNSGLMGSAKVLKNSNFLFQKRLWDENITGSLKELYIPVDLSESPNLHKFWFDKSIPQEVKVTASNLKKISEKRHFFEVVKGRLFSKGFQIERLQKFIFDSEINISHTSLRHRTVKYLNKDLDYFISQSDNRSDTSSFIRKNREILNAKSPSVSQEQASSEQNSQVESEASGIREYLKENADPEILKKPKKAEYLDPGALKSTLPHLRPNDLSTYGSMTLNVYRQQLKELQKRIRKDGGHYYTYNKNFFRLQIGPVDEVEERKKERIREKKKRLFGDFKTHSLVRYPNLHISRKEEVNTPLPNLYK